MKLTVASAAAHPVALLLAILVALLAISTAACEGDSFEPIAQGGSAGSTELAGVSSGEAGSRTEAGALGGQSSDDHGCPLEHIKGGDGGRREAKGNKAEVGEGGDCVSSCFDTECVQAGGGGGGLGRTRLRSKTSLVVTGFVWPEASLGTLPSSDGPPAVGTPRRSEAAPAIDAPGALRRPRWAPQRRNAGRRTCRCGAPGASRASSNPETPLTI